MKDRKKTDPVNILLDLIIIIMIIAMIPVGFIYYTSKSYAEKPPFSKDAQMMGFLLGNRDYAALIQGRYINTYNGDTSTEGYNALADYIEADFKLKIYDAKNLKQDAQKQEEIKQNALDQMGQLSVFTGQVDEMFGFKKE